MWVWFVLLLAISISMAGCICCEECVTCCGWNEATKAAKDFTVTLTGAGGIWDGVEIDLAWNNEGWCGSKGGASVYCAAIDSYCNFYVNMCCDGNQCNVWRIAIVLSVSRLVQPDPLGSCSVEAPCNFGSLIPQLTCSPFFATGTVVGTCCDSVTYTYEIVEIP